MPGSMLRERVPGHHARVTFVELFFDLVFVFAVTQISHTLLHRLTWQGALEAGFLLLAVWWAWIFTAWVTNWLNPEHPMVRAMLFALMAFGLLLSTSLPEAFGDRAVIFAGAYVAIQVGRTLFVLWAARGHERLMRNFRRILCWLATSAVFWVAGAFADGPARYALWGLALGIEYVAPAASFWTPGLGRTPTADWNVEGGHMAERCGLFIIICLGESVLVTGATFAELAWSPGVIAAFATAFVGSLALWWIYFSAHADAASHAISESADPGRIARVAYTYAHIPLVAGIIVTAAGDELVLAQRSGPIAAATAWVLVGGPALYLAGALWFKWSIFRVIAAPRAAGFLLLLAAGALTPWLTPLGLSALVSGVLVLVSAWETWIRFRQGHDATAPIPVREHA